MKVNINITIDIPEGASLHVNGKPYSLNVPDEKEPPPADPVDYSQMAELHEAKTKIDYESLIDEAPVKKGKRGPYKKRESAISTTAGTKGHAPSPPLTYMSIVDLGTKDPQMLGIQATPNKFLVNHAYFKGRIDEARNMYRDYITMMKEAYKITPKELKPQVLTWESWLISDNHKQLEKTSK